MSDPDADLDRYYRMAQEAVDRFASGDIAGLVGPFGAYLDCVDTNDDELGYMRELTYSSEFRTNLTDALELLERVMLTRSSASLVGIVALGPLDELIDTDSIERVREYAHTHPHVSAALRYWEEHGFPL